MNIGLAGKAQYNTGNAYVQAYNLTLRVWAGDTLSEGSTIQAALEAMIPPSTRLAHLDAGAVTLAIWLQPPVSSGNALVLAEVEQMQERLFGKWVFTAGAAWLIQLQESRV